MTHLVQGWGRMGPADLAAIVLVAAFLGGLLWPVLGAATSGDLPVLGRWDRCRSRSRDRWRRALHLAVGVAACAAMVSCGGQAENPSPISPEAPLAIFALAAFGLLLGGSAAVRIGAAGPAPSTLVGVAAALLPAASRERWIEEWRAELDLLPGGWSRVRFAASLVSGIPVMAAALRAGTGRRRRR